MRPFSAKLDRLSIDPFVSVPAAQLRLLLQAAGRETRPIPISVELNGMRAEAGEDVGDRVGLAVAYDPGPRLEPVPAELSGPWRSSFGPAPPSSPSARRGARKSRAT